MIRPMAFALFVAIMGQSASGQPQTSAGSPQPSAPASLYLLVYERGPAWIEGRPMHEQKLGEHLTYMRGLLGEGRLVAGGPFGNVAGGMAILRAPSLAEAEAVLAKDPALLNGTFIGSVREWTPYLDSREALSRR